MKKHMAIFMLGVLCFLFTACSRGDDTSVLQHYESFVCDMTNDGLITSFEKEWWTGEAFQNELVPSKRTISFDGKDYRCDYKKTYVKKFDWDATDVYEVDGVTISVKSTDNSICGFHNASVEQTERELLLDDVSNPYEYAKDVAKQYASDYIDVSLYTLEESEPYTIKWEVDGTEKEMKLYTFNFVKYKNGFRTSDRVYVQVNSKGHLRTISINNIGAFDDVDVLVDKTLLSQSVSKKLQALYADTFNSYTYEIVKQTLTLSPERELVIVSQVELDTTVYETGVLLATVVADLNEEIIE